MMMLKSIAFIVLTYLFAHFNMQRGKKFLADLLMVEADYLHNSNE